MTSQSNLGAELVQHLDGDAAASCTHASVILPSFVNDDLSFNFVGLEDTVRHVVLGLNRTARASRYPAANGQHSHEISNAIAIGVQGLADTFAMMGIPFDSYEALLLSTKISECIQYVSIDESCNLIRAFGTYRTFDESPMARGYLQLDHWEEPYISGRYDWDALRQKAWKGSCNTLLTAYMPTSDTSLITGCTTSFEPFAG